MSPPEAGGAQPRGIRRKVDDLGRVVIPASIRKALGIGEGDLVEIGVDGDRVILFKPQERCVFCGSELHLEAFRDKTVCWSCMAAIRAADRERVGESANPFL
jgi:AbrB family transcriptional regulator, transcriptional pleiotropic regulator of transition state genes